MRNLLSATALTAALVLSGPVLAQGVGSPSSGASQGSGAAGAQMQGQVPAGPLPMTQPAPGTRSTSQRPSTAAGALGATSSGQPGSAGQSSGSQPSSMGQSGSQASGSQASRSQSGGTPSTGSQSAAMAENDVRDLLRTEGYSDVQSVSRDGNNFRVRAMRNGRPTDLTVDAYTGTIRNQAARR